MRLLIIGCSKAKSSEPEILPAQARYQGTFWKVVHRALQDCPELDQSLDILVVSAEFGAITSQQVIPWYERRMSPQCAEELRPQVVAAINEHVLQRQYDDIFI